MSAILQVRDKFLLGLWLPKEDIIVAENALNSSQLIERVYACQILLAFPGGSNQSLAVLKVAAQAFEEIAKNRCALSVEFLNLLQMIPTENLFDTNAFYEVLLAAAKSDIFDFRLSAIPSLVRYAKTGDEKTMLLLQQACQDENEYVRREMQRSV